MDVERKQTVMYKKDEFTYTEDRYCTTRESLESFVEHAKICCALHKIRRYGVVERTQ